MSAANAHPARRRSAQEQAEFEAGVIRIFEHDIRFNELLGLKVLSAKPGDVRGRFEMRPELIGHYAMGRLHGGVISAVLDAIGGLAIMVGIAERHPGDTAAQALARFARVGTIDLRTDFLRQGLGQHFVATAELTRLGGRVGSVQMRLANDQGELIATAAASYIVS